MTTTPLDRTAHTPAANPRKPSAGLEVAQLTGRNLRKILREPTLVFFSMAMPVIMLTLFSQVFRSISQTTAFPAGVSYIDYLLPAVLCTTLAQSATTSSTAITASSTATAVRPPKQTGPRRRRSTRSQRGWPGYPPTPALREPR